MATTSLISTPSPLLSNKLSISKTISTRHTSFTVAAAASSSNSPVPESKKQKYSSVNKKQLQNDELATVRLFQDNTPSVVYITNLASRGKWQSGIVSGRVALLPDSAQRRSNSFELWNVNYCMMQV
nr:protease Do-like 1, chloroplastic [Tanacetum cinerariifolium]